MVWAELTVTAFIISFAFYLSTPISLKMVHTEKNITVHRGDTANSIISQLSKEGYDLGILDRVVLALITKVSPLNIGQTQFKETSPTRIDFLYKLTKAKNTLLKLILIPGETSEIFLTQIAQKLDINKTKLFKAFRNQAKYPEAAIAADTYFAPKHMNEANLMRFLLKSSQKKYKKLSTDAFGNYRQNKWHRVLTIASIIQKEAANNKEMPIVASVIYNRLKKKMKLQMDGTLNYGKYSHLKVTPQRIRTDLSSFNTYKNKGLPNSPIGAVSNHAIKAAINPAKTNYLFFMRNKDGVHDFTDTYRKHRKNIKKMQ
jgi:UPF0755 protein